MKHIYVESLILLFAFMASPALSAGKQDIGDMLPRENAFINAGTKKTVFSGNVKTKKYHNPGCKFYDCRDCTARFKSRKAAEANGYEQCQKCPGWPEE